MKKALYLLYPSIPLVAFIIWTILVKTIDVQYINDIGFLGFYDLNMKFIDSIYSVNMSLFSKLSDVLLYLSFATVIPFTVIGIMQLVKRKSLSKVDPILYFMLGGYVLAVFLYFVLDIAKINFSPDSIPGNLKPSYPSTHVFIFITFLSINAFGLFYYVKTSNLAFICIISGLFLLIIGQVVFRSLSGHHYLTDIFGGVILATFVFALFYALFSMYSNKTNEEDNN